MSTKLNYDINVSAESVTDGDVVEYADRLKHSVSPYTKEQIDAMLDMVERDFEEGRFLTHDDTFASSSAKTRPDFFFCDHTTCNLR